jgi:hypothetical protein
MSIADYELKAAGGDYETRYGRLDDNGWVWVPITAKFLAAVSQAQYQTGEETEDHIAVPLWVLAALVDGAYEPSELGLYASDSMVLAHVVGATLKDADDKGFYVREDARTAWQSLEAHAHDLAAFAAGQRAEGNAEPYMLEEGDFNTQVIPAWSAGHEFELLNDLLLTDLWEDDQHVSTKLAWLLHPITPSQDFSDGTDACLVLRHLIGTAKASDPGLAGISIRMAVVQLLHVPLPYQLWHVGITLIDRIKYISKLAAWSDTSRRSSILQADFKLLLGDLPVLSKWVRTALGPFQKALTLVTRLGGDASAIDVDTFIILDAKLATLDSAWRAGQSADANISFLLDKLPRQGSAAVGTLAGADDAAIASIDGGSEHLGRVTSLDTAMCSWAAGGRDADPMEGITIIIESGVSVAIRWLQGAATGGALPPIFKNACEALPGKLDEYVLDTLMHDDAGLPDPDLEDLTVRSFYIKGATTLASKRAFFSHLFANRFTAIDWEAMLIAPICLLLYPGQPARVWSMAEVYNDPERLALHLTYVTRALTAVGKLASAPNSHAALVDEWTSALARAKRGGAELAADCIESIVKLMVGAWASAESMGVASLRGAHYTSSLFDGSIPEVSGFRSFQEGLGPMKQMATRYKRTFASLLAPACAVELETAAYVGGGTLATHTDGDGAEQGAIVDPLALEQQQPPPAEMVDEKANRARNLRDIAKLRKHFSGFCSHHLLYHHILGRSGCARAPPTRDGCTQGGILRSHGIPEGIDDCDLEALL